jgi:PPOX class probable F420-dependent enzyme
MNPKRIVRAIAHPMSDSERRAFLLEGTRTAKLAVPRADGSPHVIPVWFVLDGDDVIFTTGDHNIKGKSIRRDGRAAMCVDDQVPPFAFVTMHGTTEWSDDLDALLPWAVKIGARYMGTDRAEEFGRRNAVPGEILVRLTPHNIVAIAGMSD